MYIDYDEPRPRSRYRCGGYSSYSGHCGATDCETCYPGGCEEPEEEEEHEVSKVRFVVARKARGKILPGDLVRVTSGFTYKKDGPRTGYFRWETLVGYGPRHGEKAGTGNWAPRGGYAAFHGVG